MRRLQISSSRHRTRRLQLSTLARCLLCSRLVRSSPSCVLQGYSIDIALPERRIALEVDGPSHFANDHTPTGNTKLKRRQLRATGWHPLSVSSHEWAQLMRRSAAENVYIERLFDLVPGVGSGLGSGQ